MTLTFVLTMVCADCKATIRFENERPPWKSESNTKKAIEHEHGRYIDCPACDRPVRMP